MDAKYVKPLDIMGISYESPSAAAQASQTICGGFDNGLTWSQLVNDGTKAGYSGYQAGEIVGVSAGMFCPQ